MFWMFLGQEPYANADYWSWKKQAESGCEKRTWVVDCADEAEPVSSHFLRLFRVKLTTIPQLKELHSFLAIEDPTAAVYLFDLVYEFFVLIGSKARDSRADIRLALAAANELADFVGPSKPFVPPVHAIILPSRIPLDFRAAFRGLDDVVVVRF